MPRRVEAFEPSRHEDCEVRGGAAGDGVLLPLEQKHGGLFAAERHCGIESRVAGLGLLCVDIRAMSQKDGNGVNVVMLKDFKITL